MTVGNNLCFECSSRMTLTEFFDRITGLRTGGETIHGSGDNENSIIECQKSISRRSRNEAETAALLHFLVSK